MQRFLPSLALLAILAGCATPPPSAFTQAGPPQGKGIGQDAAGEACLIQQGGDGALIFCGTWTSPSGHVVRLGTADAAALRALAASSPWRSGIDERLACGDPAASTVLGNPAYVLTCTRRVGGWPEVAMVTAIGGQAYAADGIQPAAPVLPRAMGVVSGTVPAEAAASLPPSGADALIATRLAAQAFSAGDIGQYEQLMLAGTRANQAEDFAAAEQAYRAALVLQEKALGKDDPDRVSALLPLALQVSNQGRYVEAEALFVEADKLAPAASDPLAKPRLLHYRALHAFNQHDAAKALALLQQAEALYAAQLPSEALRPRVVPASTLALGRSGTARVNDPVPGPDILVDNAQQSAFIGLVEARRYQALALRDLGRNPESEAAIAGATRLLVGQNVRQPALTARLLRTGAASASARGAIEDAASGYLRSSDAFQQAFPGTRPVAATLFLHAAELLRAGRPDAAVTDCRRGAGLLRELKSGIAPELVAPCLSAYADAAARAGSGAQPLLAEMFETAELAQGGITGQQIAQSAARLGETARDPRVGSAIRARQDAAETLAGLLRQRDLRGRTDLPPEIGAIPPGELDQRIAASRKTLAESDATLQTASPNFGQLVQDAVPAADVAAALAPNQAFVSLILARDGGWAFAVRKNGIAIAPIRAGAADVAALVKRVRAGVEVGSAGLPRFDTDASRALYDATLRGLEPQLAGANELVIAPFGPLLSVPFGILLTGPAGGPAGADLAHAPWLIRRAAITHVPAAANFVALRKVENTSHANAPWFGMGGFRPITLAQARRTLPASCSDDAQALASLPALPYARPELAAARALLGGSERDELLDQQFTVAGVEHAPLGNIRVIHIASHALLPTDLRCLAEPAIVTSTPPNAPDAKGALLTSSLITGLDLDADTVILSACNSAGPQGPAGESLSGLARAFFYAGARSLLATHWSINDQASAYLIAETLKRARGTGMAQSLRGAQLAVLDQAGSGLPAALAHPFYWGAFALIGDGDIVAGQRVAGL